MKNIGNISLLIVLALFQISFVSCTDDEEDQTVELILTNQEIASVQFLLEEEKLARDVYVYLGDRYNHQIFKNIANSEQTHMNSVIQIMEDYGIAVEYSNEAGVYYNNQIQNLYDELIAKGNISHVDALTVGATIEDLDISDLIQSREQTENQDLLQLYDKLQCGSENHMRAFYSQLQLLDRSYTPQYISDEQLTEILNGAHKNCGDL